jgi:hypothetical protein
MPVDPSNAKSLANVTAKYLNTNLYTYIPGNNFTPNGILFLGNRQLLFDVLNIAGTVTVNSSTAGTFTSLTGGTLGWANFFDSAALFGGGGDTQWLAASGRYNPAIPGSGGTAGLQGGYHLIWGYPNFSGTTNAGGSGAALNENGSIIPGGFQLSSTAHNNGPYVMDIVSTSSAQFTSLQAWCSDSSANTFNLENMGGITLDWSGQQTRFYGLSVCISTNNQTPVTANPPVPTTWANNSFVDSSVINGLGIVSPLEFAYNPPIFRVGTGLGTAITANTNTLIPLSTAQIDPWSGWSSGSSAYTVPAAGAYLVHGLVFYTSGSTGTFLAGIRVNGATIFWGPMYVGGATGVRSCQVTRLLDLNAGDTVQLYTLTNNNNTLSSASQSRLHAVWMSSLANSNGSVSWTVPDTGFRWQAGTPGGVIAPALASNLTTQFQTHLTNDLSFFLQRPYLLAWQSSAQTGLSQNAFHTYTFDTLGGIVHASAGDNYGGWTSGASNKYTAQVNGWYLVQGTFVQSAPGATASLEAAINPSPPGASSPDIYQHMSTTTAAASPGAEAIGVYYLRAGDSVTPQYQQQDGGATFNTNVTGGHQSSFGVVWLCE